MTETFEAGSTPEPEAKYVLLRQLREHGFPNLQSLDINVVLNTHSSYNDGLRSAQKAGEPDILAVEFGGQRPEVLDVYQRVVDGTLDVPEDALVTGGDGFMTGLLEGLRGNDVSVISSDMPARSRLFRRFMRAYATKGSISTDIYKRMGYADSLYKRVWGRIRKREAITERSQVIPAFCKHIVNAGEVIKEREEYIANNLGKKIIALLKRRPDLAEANHLDVAVVLGSLHTNVAKELHKTHPDTRISHTSPETVFGYENELMRRIIFGVPVPSDLEKGVFAEYMLHNMVLEYLGDKMDHLDNRSDMLTLFSKTMRSIVEAMTPGQHEQLLSAFIQDNGVPNNVVSSMAARGVAHEIIDRLRGEGRLA
jgi:hypothetical protein